MVCPQLLVISDSHGHLPALGAVFTWAKERVFEAAVFLGDGAEDLESCAAESGLSLPWKKVRGNGDHNHSIPEAAVLDIAGRRLFLAHGHRYALYSGYDTLLGAAKNLGAEAALFGHLHIPILENAEGILLVNPGSIGRPRSRVGPSFATIECPPKGALGVQFWGLKESRRGIEVGEMGI
jgi:putative phosphoesterase